MGIGMPGLPEIMMIGLVVLLLFGAKRIPEVMKGFGEGIRELRSGFKELD